MRFLCCAVVLAGVALLSSCGGSQAAVAAGGSTTTPPVANAIPASYMGLTVNSSSHFPGLPGISPVTFGLVRLWDTAGTPWPAIETAAGVFNFGTLDALLGDAYNNGTYVAFYTLSRTPNWASSKPADTTCSYYSSGGTGIAAPGQCDMPGDLNVDGTGTDATWIAWVSGIAGHVNAAGYTSSHAHVQYWEIWNEFDRSSVISNGTTNLSFNGTYAQLVRMTEDARCAITGKGTVHNVGSVGQSTACTATPIDATALIVAPSAHTQSAIGLNVVKNFLYCSAGAGSGAPMYCNQGASWGAAAVDIINFHMKPGNAATVPNPEAEMQIEVSAAKGILQTAEVAKPLWNGEAGYAVAGWTPGSGGGPDLSGNPDMQASFVGRYALIQWSLGIQSFSWYLWDQNQLEVNGTIDEAGIAYQQMYKWLVGQAMSTACSATGSQWTCGLTGSSGFTGQAMWDTSPSYACSAGSSGGSGCAYNWVPVAASWKYFRDLYGNETAIPTSGAHTGQVQVGNLPILLENQKL